MFQRVWYVLTFFFFQYVFCVFSLARYNCYHDIDPLNLLRMCILSFGTSCSVVFLIGLCVVFLFRLLERSNPISLKNGYRVFFNVLWWWTVLIKVSDTCQYGSVSEMTAFCYIHESMNTNHFISHETRAALKLSKKYENTNYTECDLRRRWNLDLISLVTWTIKDVNKSDHDHKITILFQIFQYDESM